MMSTRQVIVVALIALAVKWFLNPPFLRLSFLDSTEKIVKGSRVIVTGASLGIGKSLAIEFARLGAKDIVIASRSLPKLNEVKDIIIKSGFQGNIYPIAVDLSTNEASVELVEKSLALMGGLDYLILNHITKSRFGTWLVDNKNAEGNHDFIKEMFAVNTFSYMWTATAAMDALKASNGAIAVVSSLAGHVGPPKNAAYSATKHALHGFFDSLRTELKLLKIHNVGITLCAIGATDTEGAAEVKAQLNVGWDPPEDAAKSIIRGTAHRLREIYHPHHLVFPIVILNAFSPAMVDFIFQTVYS